MGGKNGDGGGNAGVTHAGSPAVVLERVTDGVLAVDPDWQVTYANPPAGDLLGRDAAALPGTRLWDACPGLADAGFEERLRAAMADGEAVDCEAYYGPTDRWLAMRAYPSETGLSVYVRDVGEYHGSQVGEGEHARRLRAVVESSTDAIMIKDRVGRYLLVNGAVADALDRPREEIRGRTDVELFGEAAGEAIQEREREVLATERTVTVEEELPMPDGPRVYESTRAPYYGPDGDLQGTVVVCRDVTDRKERERDLRRYERLVETSQDPMFALDEELEFTLVNRATERLVGFDREHLLGKPAGAVLEAGLIPEPEFTEGMAAIRELLADEGAEHRKHVGPIRTGDGDVIVAEYHLAAVDDGVVGVVRDITDHREQKRRIRRQRDQLETLDRINAVVQDAIRGVVGAATREEIERMVCERLGESEVYTFAWIGERNPDGGVTFRTGVGVDEAWFERAQGIYDGHDVPDPGTVALETGETQTTQDVLDSPDVPDAAIEDVPGGGLRSGVVVPLRYDDAIYGILAVAAPRPGAFSEREVAAFEVLGEVVGFAIDATGNRRLLLGDAVTEVELEVRDESETFVGLSVALGCHCDLERAVPVDDEGVVHYVSVGGASASAVADHLAGRDGVTAVRLLREGEDGAFLAVTASRTVPARLVAAGATPRRYEVADGEARVAAEVPPSADVSTVVEALRATFPDAEVTAKRFVERPSGSTRAFGEQVAGRLTDRQRDALAAAVAAGYYEWPRESTAEEVAESLDVSSATLHYHLRRAESALVHEFLAASG